MPGPKDWLRPESTWILGHRGAMARAPENTLASIQRAFEDGADGVELDVQPSCEGELFLFHDDRVDRCTNFPEGGTPAPRFRDLDAKTIRGLDAGSWFSEEFRGETIPRLAEALEAIAELGLVANLELKSIPFSARGFLDRFLEVLKGAPAELKVWVSSFDQELLRALRDRDSEIGIGALASDRWLDPVATLRQIGADCFHPDIRAAGDVLGVQEDLAPVQFGALPDALEERVARIREAGFGVFAWTTESPKVAQRLIELGVEGVMADDPGSLRRGLGLEEAG